MQFEFKVANVKCQGCAQAIRTGLGALAGVQQVTVDVPVGKVVVVAAAPCTLPDLAAQLAKLGYPVLS